MALWYWTTQPPCVTQCMASNMVKNRDEESGQYTETVTDDEILAYLSKQNGVGTIDIADQFDYEQPSAYRRLKQLEDEGRVTNRKIGGSLFWETVDQED